MKGANAKRTRSASITEDASGGALELGKGVQFSPTVIDIEEAQNKLQEFARYLGSVTIVDGAAVAELERLKQELKTAREENTSLKKSVAAQKVTADSLRASLALSEQNGKENAAKHEKIQSALTATKHEFTDVIQQETADAPFLITTGHVKFVVLFIPMS